MVAEGVSIDELRGSVRPILPDTKRNAPLVTDAATSPVERSGSYTKRSIVTLAFCATVKVVESSRRIWSAEASFVST